MQRYVATVQLKRVTDGNRTFWHWQSTFDVPRGREREFAELVGKGVYEAGFEGLRTYLRQSRAAAAPAPRRSARGAIRGSAIVIDRHGGADELKLREIDVAAARPGRGAAAADGDRRELHRRLRAHRASIRCSRRPACPAWRPRAR